MRNRMILLEDQWICWSGKNHGRSRIPPFGLPHPPCWTMRSSIPIVKVCSIVWRYRRIMSLHHPPHNPDCFCVKSSNKECHGTFHSHGTCANVFGLETNLWDCDCHCLSEGLGDFSDYKYGPLVLVLYCGQWLVASGSVLSKMYHMLTYYCHCIRPGMACLSVFNWLPLDSIFLVGGKGADKVGRGEQRRASASSWGGRSSKGRIVCHGVGRGWRLNLSLHYTTLFRSYGKTSRWGVIDVLP